MLPTVCSFQSRLRRQSSEAYILNMPTLLVTRLNTGSKRSPALTTFKECDLSDNPKMKHQWAGPPICLPQHRLDAWRCVPLGQLPWLRARQRMLFGISTCPTPAQMETQRKSFSRSFLLQGGMPFSTPGPLPQGGGFYFPDMRFPWCLACIYLAVTGPFSWTCATNSFFFFFCNGVYSLTMLW